MRFPRRGDRLSTVSRPRRLSLKPGVEQFEQRTLLSSAAFVTTNTTTQGTWRGTYGAQAHAVAGDSTSFPGLTFTGASYNLWYASTADPRAPQKYASYEPHTARPGTISFTTSSRGRG